MAEETLVVGLVLLVLETMAEATIQVVVVELKIGGAIKILLNVAIKGK